MSNERPKIVAIVGTNASGKSAIGIELAKSFNGEIISADSRQVYKGFDLCCGKITPEEKQIVPHYLLDVRNIGESFSVSDFQKMTYSIIPQIMQRRKLPFIVGGTGLYVSSVVNGYVMCEETTDKILREALNKLDIDELYTKLTPEGKEFLSNNPSDLQNKRRVIRVIEKTTHGEPLHYENATRYNTLQIGVTWPREVLYKRIDERLDSRIEQGMIDEVKSYLDNGGNADYLYNLGLEYRHILWYLTGKYQSIEEFKIEMSRAIKRFAKRQMTWFKRDKTIYWLDMSSDYLGKARSLISEFLEQ